MLWIVEADAFADAVRRAGGTLRLLSMDDEARGRYGRWQADETVVFRGSFEAAEAFRTRRPDAHPGAVGDPESLRCSAYYPALGERLLNLTHEFLPLGELRPRWPELQAHYGDILFVRPDSGAKAFTGGVVDDLDRFEARERPYLAAMSPGDRIVVAPPRRIAAEWRTVVVGTDVVAGSRYKEGGVRSVDPHVPADVLAFAADVATTIAPPAEAYMLDVAREDDGRLSVVELNAFASSDLYAGDPTAIVEAIHRRFV